MLYRVPECRTYLGVGAPELGAVVLAVGAAQHDVPPEHEPELVVAVAGGRRGVRVAGRRRRHVAVRTAHSRHLLVVVSGMGRRLGAPAVVAGAPIVDAVIVVVVAVDVVVVERRVQRIDRGITFCAQ